MKVEVIQTVQLSGLYHPTKFERNRLVNVCIYKLMLN